MKILKALNNDFPHWYAEYAIGDLGIFMDKLPIAFLPLIKQDIEQRGMIHPIIVYSPFERYQTGPNPMLPKNEIEKKEVLRVYMGHKRIWAAKKLGYSHISVYHVKRNEDAEALCKHTTIRAFCPN